MTDSDIAGARPASPGSAIPAGVLRSPAAKFFLTGAITVLLMIPLWMVFALTSERESRRDEVAYSIGQELPA
jgi:inner membrane protein